MALSVVKRVLTGIVTLTLVTVQCERASRYHRYVAPSGCSNNVYHANVTATYYVNTRTECALRCTSTAPQCQGFNLYQNGSRSVCQLVGGRSDEKGSGVSDGEGFRFFEQLEVGTESTTCSLRGACPEYHYVASSRTHDSAVQYCQSLNSMHLATPTSPQQLNCLVDYLNTLSSRSSRIWLGADDISQEGVWRWTASTGEVVSYSAWGGAEPNGGTNENCMDMDVNSVSWIDQRCSRAWHFVCQA